MSFGLSVLLLSLSFCTIFRLIQSSAFLKWLLSTFLFSSFSIFQQFNRAKRWKRNNKAISNVCRIQHATIRLRIILYRARCVKKRKKAITPKNNKIMKILYRIILQSINRFLFDFNSSSISPINSVLTFVYVEFGIFHIILHVLYQD